MDRVLREKRAAQLRRMGIGLLTDQYRKAMHLAEGETVPHAPTREVMMRAILDREYPEFESQD